MKFAILLVAALLAMQGSCAKKKEKKNNAPSEQSQCEALDREYFYWDSSTNTCRETEPVGQFNQEDITSNNNGNPVNGANNTIGGNQSVVNGQVVGSVNGGVAPSQCWNPSVGGFTPCPGINNIPPPPVGGTFNPGVTYYPPVNGFIGGYPTVGTVAAGIALQIPRSCDNTPYYNAYDNNPYTTPAGGGLFLDQNALMHINTSCLSGGGVSYKIKDCLNRCGGCACFVEVGCASRYITRVGNRCVVQ